MRHIHLYTKPFLYSKLLKTYYDFDQSSEYFRIQVSLNFCPHSPRPAFKLRFVAIHAKKLT